MKLAALSALLVALAAVLPAEVRALVVVVPVLVLALGPEGAKEAA